MRRALPLFATCLLLAACGSHDAAQNDQAGALDNAAQQSDPAAAAELHNQADEIRNSGAEGDLDDANSSAQNALQSAGNAAAGTPSNATH